MRHFVPSVVVVEVRNGERTAADNTSQATQQVTGCCGKNA